MAESLEQWGWDDRWEAAADAPAEPSRLARVTSQERDRWTVVTTDGAGVARLAPGVDVPAPTTGDWVIVEPGPLPADPWSLTWVLPRRSAVRRGVAGGGGAEQVLAANIDRLWIVHGLDVPPNLRRLERSLAIGWESGATPEVVLTKSDLSADPAEALRQTESVALGVRIWLTSVSDPAAQASLYGSLELGSTVALLGPSGAGKSTLINLLAGTEVVRTGEVRAGDRKGRHTTTGRELIRIHNGALLLDTPGLRELRVPALDEGLQRAFPDIDTLAEGCRYRDCRHDAEPGCGVLAAAADGHLSEDRLASFRKLMAEVAYQRRKSDPRAAAAARSEAKTAMKTLRKAHPKYKKG